MHAAAAGPCGETSCGRPPGGVHGPPPGRPDPVPPGRGPRLRRGGRCPAIVLAELGVELGPVLDRLAWAQSQADAVRSAADAEASRRRRDGEARAAALVEAARERAAADRLTRSSRARAEGDAAVADAVAAARAEVSAAADRAARRLPALVDRVRATVRAELFAAPGTGDVAGSDPRRAGAR